jgi:hypothetical protein
MQAILNNHIGINNNILGHITTHKTPDSIPPFQFFYFENIQPLIAHNTTIHNLNTTIPH